MWIRRAEYRRLLQQLARTEERFDRAQSELAKEREARMVDVRHLVSMFLRARNSYPLPVVAPAATHDPAVDDTPVVVEPEPMDPGEYEALLESAAEMGVSKEELDRRLAAEQSRVN